MFLQKGIQVTSARFFNGLGEVSGTGDQGMLRIDVNSKRQQQGSKLCCPWVWPCQSHCAVFGAGRDFEYGDIDGQ